MKGTYLLVMELPNETSLQVGKLGMVDFKKGCYVYVGSALNGLEQRIQRHLRSQKKIHWHIDYLLPFTTMVDVFYKESNRKEECVIAQEVANNLSSVPGFGCSDCICQSHLFYGSSQEVLRTIDSLDVTCYFPHTNP